MSNFKYEMKNGKCYLVVGKNRIRVEWKERYVPEAEEIVTVPESVTLNKNKLEFNNLGQSQQLTATVTPEEASENIIWSSSDTTVATVDETGLVTSIGSGTASDCIVTCSSKYDNTIKAECAVSLIIE